MLNLHPMDPIDESQQQQGQRYLPQRSGLGGDVRGDKVVDTGVLVQPQPQSEIQTTEGKRYQPEQRRDLDVLEKLQFQVPGLTFGNTTLVSRKRAKIGARAGPIWHYVAQGAPYMYAYMRVRRTSGIATSCHPAQLAREDRARPPGRRATVDARGR